MADVIYTDSYGDVERDQFALYRKANVSPSDHTDIVALFGSDHVGAMEFVRKHMINGSYRAPWPFPTRA
jgi:hypothetical protein